MFLGPLSEVSGSATMCVRLRVSSQQILVLYIGFISYFRIGFDTQLVNNHVTDLHVRILFVSVISTKLKMIKLQLITTQVLPRQARPLIYSDSLQDMRKSYR